MAAQKKAAAKKAPAKKAAGAPSSTSTRAPASGGASVSRRVSELETEVATLKQQVENLAKIFATIVAAQLQQQLLSSPDPEAHIAAFASANGITL